MCVNLSKIYHFVSNEMFQPWKNSKKSEALSTYVMTNVTEHDICDVCGLCRLDHGVTSKASTSQKTIRMKCKKWVTF